MTAKMHIKSINRGEAVELLLEGRLDSSTAPEAEEIVLQMVERFDKIILNLVQLEYISSAGLRVLKQLHIALRKKDGELELKNVNKMVMEVFEMTGFSGLLTII
jgi:anti-sigma B factor antagonist